METLRTLVPIEQYSIDEAFIPLHQATAAQALEVGWAVHDRVRRWVGMPVRVGIGRTRTLAKLANHWAKKTERVFYLHFGSPDLEKILADTPTQNVWGIGRRQADKLERLGILNARQLRDMDLDLALKHLSVVGQRTVMELRGEQRIMEDNAPVPRRTLISSRSFGRGVSAKEDLAQALAMHAAISAERLRLEGLEAGAMRIHMSTSAHSAEPYTVLERHIRLPVPTNITSELISATAQALEACYKPGFRFLKGGIMLYELSEQKRRQLSLLEACPAPAAKRKKDLMIVLDKVNERFGRDALRYLAQGPDDASWHMRRNKMSPLATTRWSDLVTVKI